MLQTYELAIHINDLYAANNKEIECHLIAELTPAHIKDHPEQSHKEYTETLSC